MLLGPHAVLEAARAGAGRIVLVLVAEGSARAQREAVDELRGRGVRVEIRPAAELDALARGARHQGLLALAGEYPYGAWSDVLGVERQRPILALDELTDPHNFGAIVRSAVAFGAGAIVTLKDRACPVTPAVVRAAAGATEHARIVRVTNLARALDELRERGREVVGLDARGEVSVAALGPSVGGRVLVIGSEGRGLRPNIRRRCDRLAAIPMAGGTIASLNASVAAAVALYAIASAEGSAIATGQTQARGDLLQARAELRANHDVGEPVVVRGFTVHDGHRDPASRCERHEPGDGRDLE